MSLSSLGLQGSPPAAGRDTATSNSTSVAFPHPPPWLTSAHLKSQAPERCIQLPDQNNWRPQTTELTLPGAPRTKPPRQTSQHCGARRGWLEPGGRGDLNTPHFRHDPGSLNNELIPRPVKADAQHVHVHNTARRAGLLVLAPVLPTPCAPEDHSLLDGRVSSGVVARQRRGVSRARGSRHTDS